MSDIPSRRPNIRLADARRRLLSPSGSGWDMTRQEVADAANAYLWDTHRERGSLDRNYIGKLEQGKHRWPRHRHREALRHVLQVSSDAELGFYIVRGSRAGIVAHEMADVAHDGPTRGTEEPDVHRRQLLNLAVPGAAALITAIANPLLTSGPESVLPSAGHVDGLVRAVQRVRRAYQHSQYKAAIDALPAVLAVLQRQQDRDRSPRLAKLDAEAHQVASALLLKSEQSVLAAVAAERSLTAARRSEDQLTEASSARAVVHCLMASGHPQSAMNLAADAADRLDRAVNLDVPEAVSVYGALLLRGAIAAARLEDHDRSQVLLEEAGRAARRLGHDGNFYWTAFGPTNVAAHRVAVAVELGDAGTAVRLASTVDIAKLYLPERRAVLLLDVARAFTQWGKWERAFEAIRRAERHAPQEVRTRPAAHSMIDEVALRAPESLRRHVHDYARTVGAAV